MTGTRILKTAFAGCLAAAMAITAVPAASVRADKTGGPAAEDVRSTPSAVNGWTAVREEDTVWQLDWRDARIDGAPAVLKDGAASLEAGKVLQFDMAVPADGTYLLMLEYKPKEAKVLDCLLHLTVQGSEHLASLPILWADKSTVLLKDRYGNELLPEQISPDLFVSNVLEDYRRTDCKALSLALNQGNQAVSLYSEEQDLTLRAVCLQRTAQTPSYDGYLASQTAAFSAGSDFRTIQAEQYAVKSNSFIRGAALKNPDVSPYDTYKKRINVLDANSWKRAGQKILWEFTVDTAGYYRIGARYLQNATGNQTTYRTIEIDGAVPFQEYEAVAFPSTKTGEYRSIALTAGDGRDLYVYLDAGRHTVSMKATMGPYIEVYDSLVALMERINSYGMDLKKLTAGQTDENRTWDMDTYLPDLIPNLEDCASELDALYEKLCSLQREEPVYANNLTYAAKLLRKFIDKPRELPNHTDMLSEGDNSASKYIGMVVSQLSSQPLSLDCLYLLGDGDLPKAGVSWLTKLIESVKAFFYSFSPEAGASDYAARSGGDQKELKVWVNRAVPYVDTLQQLLDADFNAKNNTNIRLSIMPNEQKLILSNASGTNPDVVLGVGYATPFNFAIRGAAKNLLEYDGFLQEYSKQYNLESLVPLCYADGLYGAIETQNYEVLFYRKDILNKLNIKVPDTWDDVKEIMPQLLRYSMNFYLPLATASGYKSFPLTSPYVYQNGGGFYTDNGMATAIDTDNALAGLTKMTELFSIYGIQETVPNFFNSMRYGEIPIGIGNFSTYLQLTVAAPELADMWDIALTPGTVQEDGSIVRYRSADSTACMILQNTQQADLAVQFLNWWLSKPVQLQYAYRLQSSYGLEYLWNTANLEAFAELPYGKKQKEIILKQWTDQKETLSHPAQYMVERQVSNIWNNVVLNNDRLIESVDRATIASNREILRKMAEFGYCDSDGTLKKTYVTDVLKRLQAKANEKGDAKE